MPSSGLLDHFRSPRNAGELESPAVCVDVENPACGDMLRLSARWEDGVIAAARFKARGCAASIAAGSALTELMLGRTRSELEALRIDAIEAAVGGLDPESKHAAQLGADAIKALLAKGA